MVALVVDSGRLHWRIGKAGDDSATTNSLSFNTRTTGSFTPSFNDSTLNDGRVFPEHGDVAALQARWQTNVSLGAEYVLQNPVLPAADDVNEDEHLDGTAVFTCSVCDDSESKHVQSILEAVFSPDSSFSLGVSWLDIVPQELLIVYASGQLTGLVVNLGLDITILGIYEGHILGETVRRVPMVVSEDAYLADAAAWERRMRLATLVMEALEAAPVDVRRTLSKNVLLGGGRWGGWAGLREHLNKRLVALWEDEGRRRPVGQYDRPRVIQPPEAGLSAWLGESILGSLGNYLTTAMRKREQWLESGAPTEGTARWKNPLCALPPDRLADAAVRMARARESVRAASSLCAKLPIELQDAIAEFVAPELAYPDVPALRTTAYLPPREVIGADALEERLARARDLAEQRSSSPEPVQEQTPSRSGQHGSVVFSKDGVFVLGEDEGRGCTRQLAKCFEELAAKVEAGERWLVTPWPMGHGVLGYEVSAYCSRVGDTLFTQSHED